MSISVRRVRKTRYQSTSWEHDDVPFAGAALKLRLGESLLKVGEMTVETPVFDTSDKRLQPQYARGFFLQSDDLDRVRIQAGRFTAFKEQASSSGHGDFDGYGASSLARAKRNSSSNCW